MAAAPTIRPSGNWPLGPEREHQDMGESVHQTTNEVSAHFAFRSRLSLGVIAVLGAIGLIAITVSVTEIDGHLAIFIMGVGSCICAFQMIIGWGASDGHGRLARLAVEGHEALDVRIGERLDQIEAIEQQTSNAVVIALDDLRARRSKRGG